MPLSTPVFADVATRLRHGPIAACEAAGTAPRLPSTRSLDRRWDQSRGIAVTNAKRRTCLDRNRNWARDRTAQLPSHPASHRAYGTRSIGAQTPPAPAAQKQQRPAVRKPSSFVDSAHKVTGFGGASLKQSEELKTKLDQLTKENNAKEQELKSKDDALRKHTRDMADLRRKHDDTQATLVRTTDKLQQSQKQEKDTRKLLNAAIKKVEGLERDVGARDGELLAVRRAAAEAHQAHQTELRELRDSSADGIAANAPILEAARVEGEKRAQQDFDKQLQELNESHAADLNNREQNMKRQWAAEEANLRSGYREELDSERAHLRTTKTELAKQTLRIQQVSAKNSELQEQLEGRQARGRSDRVDYHGYRDLFYAISDQAGDILGDSRPAGPALRKESDCWQRALSQFQQSPELQFFHQQPKYSELKRSINSFLGRRKQETDVAAEANRVHHKRLLDARGPLYLQGHATRMLTRLLHFESDSTEAAGVEVYRYMTLALPWAARKDTTEKEIETLEAQPASAFKQSRLKRLRELLPLINEHSKHAKAFIKLGMLQAFANSRVEDRLTYARMLELQERTKSIGKLISVDSTLRRRLDTARRQADQMESIVRKRFIVQQDLGQIDERAVKAADEIILKRISVATHEWELAMDVTMGERKSSAITIRERRAEQVKAASTAKKASTSIDQLAATLAADPKMPQARIHTLNRKSRRLLLTNQWRSKQRVALAQRRYAALRLQRAKEIKANGEPSAATQREFVGAKQELRSAELDRAMEKSEDATRDQASDTSGSKQEDDQASDTSGSKQEVDHDNAASSTAPGLNLKPSNPLQACHELAPRWLSKRQAHVLQWQTLSDTLGPEGQSSGQSLTASIVYSVLTSPRPPTVCVASDQGSGAGSVELPVTTFLTGQSSDNSALSQSASYTHAPISAESPPSTADVYAPIMSASLLSAESDVQMQASPPSSISSYVPSDDGSCDGADKSQPAEATERKQEAHTLLDYQIPQKEYREAVMASPTSNAAYWSHQLYKTLEGKSPTVYYCKTLETAERQCKLFLGEPVLGFDLEWESGASAFKSPIKKAVSLVQIAAEDKICLIHVACFTGEKIEQLLPPSLKIILEDSNITKAGVNIGGDATRMRQCFGVDMKGVFELSHMYRLVKMPEEVSFKLVSLATQVQNTLLLPLKKDEVRTSAWSKSLNMQQCAYAAADAYAGFRLFYQLDNLRKDMKPSPPRPAFAETLGPIILGDGTVVERAATRAKSGAKKAAVPDLQAESDDEFFDALEDLPDTYGLDSSTTRGDRVSSTPKAIKDGEVDIDEADPESVNALSDMLAEASLGDSPSAKDVRTSASGTKSTPDINQAKVVPSAKPVRQAPHVLVASPETILADMWVASLPSRNPKVGAASLRAYHLWHHQNYSIKDVASICRQPPLAMTSVASYIMTAIKEEDMPYEKERLREAFQHLPKSVWHVYGKWVRELGLDK